MGRTHPSVFTIPAGLPFARALAAGVVERVGRDPLALADVVVLLPTRRSARRLQDEFAAVLGGAALGPKIRTLGDLDEEEIGFGSSADLLDLPPPMPPLRRRLLLATLVERWARSRAPGLPFAQAVAHAGELGRFLDEVTTQSVDLDSLKHLAPPELAEHWQDVLGFLDIVAAEWPKLLAANGAWEQAARRDELIRRYAAMLSAAPPSHLMIAAGSTGSIPATAELLKVIANLPSGTVVLPGLDTTLDAASWDQLDAGHAQYGLRQLLQHIGIAREEVEVWRAAHEIYAQRQERVHFLNEALRPPPTTDAWRELLERKDRPGAAALQDFAVVDAANPREEALVIALALREALEAEGTTAALVTPDRGLGRRVATELQRWDIAIDDSAGTKLSRTPPGTFLALLARAAADEFAPVAMLALLKHPLAAGGSEPGEFRHRVRMLERAVFRGLRPAPGLSGIAEALARKEKSQGLGEWFVRVAEKLAPFAELLARDTATLAEVAEGHARAAERLAASKDEKGAARLWRGDNGEAAATFIADLIEHGHDIALNPRTDYAPLFRDLADMRVVRPVYGRHPRLAILGPLEARLQHFDLIVLGGLNEGTWPAAAATDPWLSRPMREAIGLEAPERRIGLAAHDFAMAAAAPRVIVTRALKQDGAPTTASRWLLRIQQLAKGLQLGDALAARKDLLHWARAIDNPARVRRTRRPEPKPPQDVRPRVLSVTEIEKWLRDPYAIYAKHILRLKPLEPIDVEPGPRERGIGVHNALERFLRAHPGVLPDDALAELVRYGDEAFREKGASPAALALWGPRFRRAATWFLLYEAERRKKIAHASLEVTARLAIPATSGDFTLTGRADRIEALPDGTAAIIDYKTGRVPSQRQMESLLSPQLPLEAIMLMRGAFAGVTPKPVSALFHIKLSGGEPPGEIFPFKGNAAAIAAKAIEKLTRQIERYDNAAEPYGSRDLIERLTDVGDYDHLARVREWLAVGSEE
jgi:ATP-dependent helicase/nuclease subunit B